MLDGGTAAKAIGVALFFGAGLIPSVLTANNAALSQLSGAISSTDGDRAALDGPALPCSPLLCYRTGPLLLSEVANVLRFSAEDVAALRLGGSGLSRDDFERAVSDLPPPEQWPTITGRQASRRLDLPTGSRTLRRQQPTRLSIDATWVALSGGSPVVSPQEVQRCVSRWRPDAGSLDVGAFETNLLQGRATQLSGYVVLFGLQLLVIAILVVDPLMQAMRE